MSDDYENRVFWTPPVDGDLYLFLRHGSPWMLSSNIATNWFTSRIACPESLSSVFQTMIVGIVLELIFNKSPKCEVMGYIVKGDSWLVSSSLTWAW